MRAIEVEHVSKEYRIGAGYYLNLREALMTAVTRRRDPGRRSFLALKEVGFTVDEGEVVGIIGRNGAGKSTLLKILARVTQPTAGVARMRGRVGPLLEVGTGFHPDLTGRENIFLNGAILGMTRADIRRRFDDIVTFAGVEPFLDTPLKRYSSGMYLRLAFSVAAHVEPDIVVVDEVLAVGDADFQKRCLGKMSEFGREGRTVLFVSHDLGAITRICPRAIWLDDGRIVHDGPSSRSVELYLDARGERASYVEFPAEADDAVQLVSVGLADSSGALVESPRRDKPFAVRVRILVRRPCTGLDVGVFLLTRRGIRVLEERLSDENPGRPFGNAEGEWEATVTIPPVLAPGDYVVGIHLGTPYHRFVDREVLTFRLLPRLDTPRSSIERSRLVQPDVDWHVRAPGPEAPRKP